MFPINFSSLPNIDLGWVSFTDFFNTSRPLFFFVGSIFIYSLFIFKFYRFLARRDILDLKLQQYSADLTGYIKTLVVVLLYILKNLIVIPLLIFFWFVVLAVILIIINKTQTAETVLLISMAIVAAVRVASYYQEELAQEIAKLIPFSMLALFLVDISYFSLDKILITVQGLPSLWKNAIYYLVVVVTLEFMLRMIMGIEWLFTHDKNTKEGPPAA